MKQIWIQVTCHSSQSVLLRVFGLCQGFGKAVWFCHKTGTNAELLVCRLFTHYRSRDFSYLNGG